MLLILLLPAKTHAYLGPTHCTKPGTSAVSVLTSSAANIQSSSSSSSTTSTTTITKMGYSTYNHLLFDLISLSNDYQSGQPIPEERLTFTLCPNKVIDLDTSTLPLGYLPIDVPRTTIQCGSNGSIFNNCIIRGGGKRNSQSTSWNTNREHAYKNNEFGILGGGEDNVAQIYIYGESAYEVTLKGLTMDNSITEEEMRLYQEYVAHFGSGGKTRRRRNLDDVMGVERNIQMDDIEGELDTLGDGGGGGGGSRSGTVQPAHRLTSIAVRGKGYGDDAGPRLITIDNCKFTYHRGYAILVSSGIQGPDMPMAPKFNNPQSAVASSPNSNQSSVPPASLSESQVGQISINEPLEDSTGSRTKQRALNLLDDGAKYIPADGQVTYYDQTTKNHNNNIDGHRVKIINSEFINNIASDENVAGLVTSAFSLTVSNCLFERNSARAIVFVYNHEARVENTMFVENSVDISTVIMQTPKGQGSKNSPSSSSSSLSNKATNVNNTAATIVPTAMDATHIVQRSCFLGSHVGMSNVLVTDATDSGYTQRDNHGKGTEYTWASKCEDGAAEKVGNDCTTNANCIGKCVQFTSEECLADRVVTSKEYELFMNDGYTSRLSSGWRRYLSAMLVYILYMRSCCLLYTSPSPRDLSTSRMPSSA